MGEVCLFSKSLPLPPYVNMHMRVYIHTRTHTRTCHPRKIQKGLSSVPFKGFHAVCTPSGTSHWHIPLADTHGIMQCFPNSSMYVPYSSCLLSFHTICLIDFFKSTWIFFNLNTFQNPHHYPKQKTSILIHIQDNTCIMKINMAWLCAH